MLIGRNMIDMRKAAVVFMKTRRSLFVWWREKKFEKKTEDGKKMYFLKLQLSLNIKAN